MRIPSLRTVAIAVALGEGVLLLGLVVYLAASGKTLQLRVALPAEPRSGARLVIPVAGVRAAELADSYGAARSGGRSHKGVDISAREGTPVLAASAGVIVKLASSKLGGISLYHRDADGRTVYYYAHLQRYRAGIKEGDLVRAGDVIAYVGRTGNAPAGNPHLHFAVYTVSDPNRWWRGRDLNPYPLLVETR
jgi:murein DD-endopeptidase MepM/ murein hydrolase activator NlpD